MAGHALVDLETIRERRRRRFHDSTAVYKAVYDRRQIYPSAARPDPLRSVSADKASSVKFNRLTALRTVLITFVLAAVLWAGYISFVGAVNFIADRTGHIVGSVELSFDTREIVVRSGDTLWSIARTHGPAGFDTREIVDWIRLYNGLSSATVFPGQVLQVPVHSQTGAAS